MTKTTKQLINEAVTLYKQTRDELHFEEAYELCRKRIEGTARKYARSWTTFTYEDFLSEGNYRFHKVALAYDETKGDFENILNRALRNAFVQLTRDPITKIETTPRFRELDGEIVDILDATIIEGITKDASIEAEQQVSKSKRRELIESLLVGIDYSTLETIKVYLQCETFSEAGAILGISRTTVMRRLAKLADKFDASTFGDIADYLHEGGNEYVAR